MTINDKTKLAILAPLKTWGGLESKFVILCNEFLEQGIYPDLLITRGGQIPYPDHFPNQVKIIELNTRGKIDAVPKVAKYLRNNKPSALLTAKDHGAKVGVLAKRLSDVETPVYIKITNTLSQILRKWIKRKTASWLYPWANGLIAISQGVRQDMIQHFGFSEDLLNVIYNPVLTKGMNQRTELDPEHPWLQNKQIPVFLGAGRLSAQKDFPNLVRAFAMVRAKRNCKLIILGEGGERTYIEKLIHDLNLSNDVQLPGFVSDPLPWMARSSVFVLSSRYEGLGNVLIEAMAAGTTLVSTNCPSGPCEILENGRLGHLVPVGDSESLAKAMLQALDNPMNPHKLKSAATRFRSDEIAKQYLRLMGFQR